LKNAEKTDMINIAIADDHHQVRETWNFILSTDESFKIVAVCANGQEAIEAAGVYQPDVFLMDINMEPVNGIEAASVISRRYPRTRIVGLSIHAEPVYVRKMLEAGASGYVTKNSSYEEVVEAIKAVHAGGQFICREVKNAVPGLNINNR
jgi:DNA-binding NarL/FixJ family response regulator